MENQMKTRFSDVWGSGLTVYLLNKVPFEADLTAPSNHKLTL